MMLTLSRRTAAVAPRYTAAALSTQTEAALADVLNQARWSDCRDEVKEIAKLMREGTTNHSVALPTDDLQHQVSDNLRGLRRLVENRQHQQAFHQVHSLKTMVKDQLYNRQQMMSFSTNAHYQDNDINTVQFLRAFEKEMEALRWADIKNEVQELKEMMREGTTNHAVALPSAELSKAVAQGLNEVDALIHGGGDVHDQAYQRVHQLKSMIKAELYKK